MAVKLLPHNEETYQRMIGMFETLNRVAVVQPTGTGKSFVALKWIEDSTNDSILVLSPSEEIFTQLHRYADEEGLNIEDVTMITYQLVNTLEDKFIEPLKFDKIILDEFHRAGAECWGPKLQRVLDNNPDAKILGLTATPIRYLDDSRNMADELFDNNFARYMTLGEAIEREILPVPNIVPVWYDFDGRYEDYDSDKEKQVYEAKRALENSYGIDVIFKKYMKPNGKYLVFCRNKEHLYEMEYQMLQWVSNINKSVNIYVTLSWRSDKDRQIKYFADDNSNSLSLLFSVDRANEGLHIPGIDGIIMLRPTESPIIYLQQIGRALTSSNINESPVIFDMVNNSESIKYNMKGENALEKEIFDSAKSRGTVDNDDLSFRVFEMMVGYNELLSKLNDILYYDNDDIWNDKFELLKEFIDEFNRIPTRFDSYKGKLIGLWLAEQRRVFSKGNMPEERQEKLVSLGIVLENLLDKKWDEMFKLLEEFIDEFNRIPTRFDSYKGKNIGKWVSFQRANFNENKLLEDRKNKLESLGIVFENLHDKKWDEMFKLLEEFIDEFNRIPNQLEKYKEINIGTWITTQKQSFSKGILSKERQEKLKELGINLNTIPKRSWDESFEILKEFIIKFARLPKSAEIYKDVHIGSWLYNQKRAYLKNKLSKERQKKLESLGIVFE